MNHRHTTAGERLAALIHDEHLNDSRLTGIADSLRITGRADDYARYFRELAAVSVACRLVAYACGLCDRGDGGTKMDDDNPIFQRRLRNYLREHLAVYDKGPQDKLYRHVVAGRKASVGTISRSVKKSLQNEAKRRGESCYLCGQRLEDAESKSHAAITIDHIWPQCFGGDSDEENLLPACRGCNSDKKQNFATWSMVAIQSVALGWNPQKKARDCVDGSIRFARHHLAVWIAASESKCSLKDAYRRIGPWTEVSILDTDNDCDFFNIELTESSNR